MHIMKIKGRGKTPDYIQIRDDEFTLISYFKASAFATFLKKEDMLIYLSDIDDLIKNKSYGELYYIQNK